MCCQTPIALLLVNQQELNIGKCARQEHDTFWNAQPATVVVSSNGVRLHLSPNAVQQIQNVYTGMPLLVNFVNPRCCGGGTCSCYCQGTDCVFHTADVVTVQSIWFGNRPNEPTCPDILGCCCNCCNLLLLQKLNIDGADVTLYHDNPPNYGAVTAQPPMDR